jgi:putative transposase
MLFQETNDDFNTLQQLSSNVQGPSQRVKKSLSVRTHIYPICGLVMDRDENAARNILKKAQRGIL